MPRDRSGVWIDVLVQADKALVRKMTFYGDKGKERVAAKYGLSKSGEWILVPEATTYPDECILPVIFHDPVDDFPMGFMDGTAASMLDFVLMGGDLCEALGLVKEKDA